MIHFWINGERVLYVKNQRLLPLFLTNTVNRLTGKIGVLFYMSARLKVLSGLIPWIEFLRVPFVFLYS